MPGKRSGSASREDCVKVSAISAYRDVMTLAYKNTLSTIIFFYAALATLLGTNRYPLE